MNEHQTIFQKKKIKLFKTDDKIYSFWNELQWNATAVLFVICVKLQKIDRKTLVLCLSLSVMDILWRGFVLSFEIKLHFWFHEIHIKGLNSKSFHACQKRLPKNSFELISSVDLLKRWWKSKYVNFQY